MTAPCHWWDPALQSWCAATVQRGASLATIHEILDGEPCPFCGAALPTCATCVQARRDGRCRVGHLTRPEPCREYLPRRRAIRKARPKRNTQKTKPERTTN